MGAARPRPLLLVLLLALVTLSSACADSHHVYRTRSGLEIHTFNRDYTNAHVVVSGERAFMVDAGLEGNAPALARAMIRAGIDPSSLEAVVLSHGHADHAGGASWFQRTHGIPIVVGRGDEELLSRGANDRLCPTDATARRRLPSDQAATYAPFTAPLSADGELDLLELTGISARAMSLPGHTEGSLIVVLDEVALVGDLFRGAIAGPGAREHFYMCDLEDNRDDIRHVLQDLAPAAEVFFTGHFGPVKRAAVERAWGPR